LADRGGRTSGFEIDEARLRRWLSLLRKPDQLASSEVLDLLRFHGRLPSSQTTVAVGEATLDLLTETIEKLKPSNGEGRDRQLPYLVLKTCFLDGAKLWQAANQLGLSERQLSRERARAISILRAELEAPAADRSYHPEPIPTIRGFLPRPAQQRAIQKVLEEQHLAHVHGPPGIGKTSLIAELASDVSTHHHVLWYRLRPDVNTSLMAILFELGEFLFASGHPELADYTEGALPSFDVAVATRLALKGLSSVDLLLVFDDYHLVEDDHTISALIDELVARLPQIRTVTIGRHRYHASNTSAVEIPPLTRIEVGDLLSLLGVKVKPALVRALHNWTDGNAYLIRLAASWLKTAADDEVSRGIALFREQEDVQSFLLSNVTELLDSDDRALLEAASIFNDRFTDDALAFVAGRTRGAILDASLRLVRSYVATRSRAGDSAFFHTSVRDYVYARLEPARRADLHVRAAEWYKRKRKSADAAQHREWATKAAAEAGLDRPPPLEH
jgi:ATP/maltotriose-dependent transcriptional regulator MalT